MAGVVETSDPSCLKDYAIVQYIRGCIYNVRYRRAENRITDRYFGLVREQRGKTIPFVYPDWDIDTVDADPIYQSASGEHASHRLNHYRYAKVPLRMKNDPASIRADEKTVFNAKNYGFLSEEDVTPSQYFVTDLPTLADWVPNAGNGEEEWLNTSLEFDTCVYRTKDVPTSGLPAARGTPKESGGPLACLSWSHKQTFDPAKRMYQPHSGIDPACSEIASRVSSRRRDTQE